MAVVRAKYPRPCPNCGSSKVLRSRLGYNGAGSRAQCQHCGFLIFKSDRRVAVEALGTLMMTVPAILLGLGMFRNYSILQLLVMAAGLGLIFYSYRMPDSDKAVESGLHALGSTVTAYGEVLLFAVALLVWIT